MTQEEKSLLIKDLCARLPYGVQVQDTRCGISGKLHDMLVFPLYKGNDIHDYIATTNFYTDCYYDDIVLFKPYLLPLSSMTEEQKNDCPINETNLNIMTSNIGYGIIEMPWRLSYLFVDWCNKNHFDYRGLIEKGLAIDATNLNIY